MAKVKSPRSFASPGSWMKESLLKIKRKILFLCTHNSARSQMAEGLLRAMYGDRYEAYSAGVEATAVDPRAVRAMKEIDIDISGQRFQILPGIFGPVTAQIRL